MFVIPQAVADLAPVPQGALVAIERLVIIPQAPILNSEIVRASAAAL